MSQIIVMTGQVHTPAPGHGCFFTVFEHHTATGTMYSVQLLSPYGGNVVDEPTGEEGPRLLTLPEVFEFLNDRRDW